MSTASYIDCEARFFSRSTGLRLAVNPDEILSLSWELLEAGGTGQITVELAHAFDDLAWPVQGDDILEIWVLGVNPQTGAAETVPRCRGAVGHYDKTLDRVERYLLTSYGRMEDMNHVLLDRILLVPGGADLSYFAAQIADDYARRRPNLSFVRDIQPVGSSLKRLEQANAAARAGMDQLQAQAGGNVTWGWDIDPATGLDRFFFRPKVETVGHQFFVGGTVKVLSSPSELQNIVNGMKIQGGPAKYPQLLTNPSFEIPSLPDAATGSLLTNGGFESLPGVVDDVHYVGGASRAQHDPSANHNASAHSGTWYAILDHAGEEVYWEKPVVPGKTYRTALYAAREKDVFASSGRLIVEGRASAGGAVLESYTLPLAPASTAWSGGQPSTVLAADGLSLTVIFASASVTAARLRIVADNGGLTQGLLIDDVTFGEAGAVGTTAWSTHLEVPGSSANRFNSIDWACPAAAWDGYYGVRLNVTADGGHKPALAPYPGDQVSGNGFHFKPGPQQSIRTGFRVRMSPGLATGPGSVTVEYREWASDGHVTQFQHADFTIPNDGAWHFVHIDISAHGDADTATSQLTFFASGWYDVDGATARDAQAGEGSDAADPLGLNTFLRGSNFEKYVTAESVCTSGSDADIAAAASFSLYGRQEAPVSNDQIIDWNPDAIQWAAAYFGRVAVPLDRPQAILDHEPVQIVSPGDGKQVRISGVTVDPTKLLQGKGDLQDWCPKATYLFSKMKLGLTLDLSSERPTWAKLLLNINASGGGGNASSIASGGGIGGGTATPAASYFGPMPHTSSDSTLHDAYTAAPHASQAAQDAWTGTSAEVVAARTRTVKGISYTTVEGRVDAMDVDIAALTPGLPAVPIGVSYTNLPYNGSAMQMLFAPQMGTTDPALSGSQWYWQKSLDSGATWTGPDGTSSSRYPGWAFLYAISAGTVRARVQTENTQGATSVWVPLTTDVAYAAPTTAGVASSTAFGTVETDITETGGSVVPTLTTYAANKVNTDATTAETVAARVRLAISPFSANTYATLKSHMDGLWTAIAAIYNRTVTAGTGLTGGGALTGNISLALAAATASVLGGIKAGSGLSIAGDGTLSTSGVTPRYWFLDAETVTPPSAGYVDTANAQRLPFGPAGQSLTYTFTVDTWHVGTAPGAGGASLDFLKNGTSLLTAPMTIASGSTDAANQTAFGTATAASGDVITPKYVTVNGSDLWSFRLYASTSF